jgi:hypothetical protein
MKNKISEVIFDIKTSIVLFIVRGMLKLNLLEDKYK